MNNFSSLKLPASLLKAIDALGYSEMTPIQAQSLPPMLAGRDVRAQARTGSGKTAAFSLALLAQLQADEVGLRVLVLCPTRELADQVSKEIRGLARFIPNLKITSLCGGVPIRTQLASLTHEPHVAVGTPGRIKDLIGRKALDLSALATVVLDEADRMLDMGFLDVVEEILSHAPKARNTWLFSATYPEKIGHLSARFQQDPVAITVETADPQGGIEQSFLEVENHDKPNAVIALLLQLKPESCLIFCNTKNDTRELAATLRQHGIPALELHGDREQRDRDETLLQFANGSYRILVATDVAARGLDIKALPLVIGYELPSDPDTYVHRIGRTGRAGASGVALTLVSNREMPRSLRIEETQAHPITWGSLPAGSENLSSSGANLPPPQMHTLVIDAGRRDKLRPGDILGALTGDAGLPAKSIGKIDCFSTRAYVAIEAKHFDTAWKALRAGKIKGRNFRVRKLTR